MLDAPIISTTKLHSWHRWERYLKLSWDVKMQRMVNIFYFDKKLNVMCISLPINTLSPYKNTSQRMAIAETSPVFPVLGLPFYYIQPLTFYFSVQFISITDPFLWQSHWYLYYCSHAQYHLITCQNHLRVLHFTHSATLCWLTHTKTPTYYIHPF